MLADSDSPIRSPSRALGQAAVDAISELAPGDLLAGVTPDRIGQFSGYAPSSVRYQLSRAAALGPAGPASGRTGRWAFDRERVLLVGLDTVVSGRLTATERAVDRYVAALDTEDPTELRRALDVAAARDLAALSPAGPKASRPGRVWLIANATADTSTAVAERVAAHRADQVLVLAPLVTRSLERTGRTPVGALTVETIASQLLTLIEGTALQAHASHTSAPALIDAAVGLLLGLTTPTPDATAGQLDLAALIG